MVNHLLIKFFMTLVLDWLFLLFLNYFSGITISQRLMSLLMMLFCTQFFVRNLSDLTYLLEDCNGTWSIIKCWRWREVGLEDPTLPVWSNSLKFEDLYLSENIFKTTKWYYQLFSWNGWLTKISLAFFPPEPLPFAAYSRE